MAKTSNVLFEIRKSGRKLRFLKSRVVLDEYCPICDNWLCLADAYQASRRAVRAILALPIGKTANRTADLTHRRTCLRTSATHVQLGCKKFDFTQTEMRRIRKWANK